MAWKVSNRGQSTLRQAAALADLTIYVQAAEAASFPALGVGDKAKAVLFNDQYYEIVNITTRNLDGSFVVERGQESTSARDWGAGTKVVQTLTAEVTQVILSGTTAVKFFGTATQGGNLYTINVGSGNALPSFAGGEELAFQIPGSNTGAVTIAVTDGVTTTVTKSLVHQDNMELEARDLSASWYCVARYDAVSGKWFLTSESSFNDHVGLLNDGPIPAINRHPNGGLRAWNGGTSFSTPASGSVTADGWYVYYDGAIGAFSVSRQAFTLGQTDVPGDPQYFLRWDHSSAGSGSTFRRIRVPIPGVEWRNGEKVTRRIYAKADSNRTVTGKIIQHFGTGGAPSADVEAATVTMSVTTSWQAFDLTATLPSISGKTLGSNNDHELRLQLDLPLNTVMSVDFAMDDLRQGHLTDMADDTWPLPVWRGGTGGVYNSFSAMTTALLAAHIAAGDPHTVYALESALGTAAYANIGTSGNTVPKNDTANIFSQPFTYNNGLSAGSDATYRGSIRIEDNPGSVSAAGGLEFKASPAGSGYGWRLAALDPGGGVNFSFMTRQSSASWTEVAAISGAGAFTVGGNAVLTTASVGSAAYATIGTSGDTVPKNNTANTFSARLTLAASSPELWISETDQVLPAGLWRITGGAGAFVIQRNTSAGGDFGTATAPITISTSDTVALSGSLTVGGNAVLTTATGAQLSGATFTGAVTVSGTALNLTHTSGNAEVKLYDNVDGGFTLFSQDGTLRIASLNTSGSFVANLLAVTAAGELSGGTAALGIATSSETSGTLTSASANRVVKATAGITVNDGVFTAGDHVEVYNDTASSITITQDTGMTLGLAGSTSTGNRTLAARAIAVIYFDTTSEAYVGGTGVS